MGKIVVHEFISLDGSFEDPSFTMEYGFPDDLAAAIGAIVEPASGLLLGRVTFEMFGPAWSGRTADDDPGAPFFNDSPKHVVTSTLSEATGWQNSSILGPYDAEVIRKLKADNDGDFYISGSGTLVRALLADGLIDELHLFVYPVVLGEGAQLFPTGSPRIPLSLNSSEVLSNGVNHLTYGPA